MTLRLRVSAEAEADLQVVYDWYERAQPGLGSVFLQAVDTALAQVADWPTSGRIVDEDIRRVLTRRFPYGLSYVVNEDEVFVVGCFHVRRDPEVWRSRRPQ